MSYLMDVNVLIAWAWNDHSHNLRVRKWIGSLKNSRKTMIYTCPITEIGFIRVSLQKTVPQIEIAEAASALERLLRVSKTRNAFLPDDLSSCRQFPEWCKNAKNTTDAHLLALAEKHGLQLATLDTGIPGAFLIP